MRQGTLLFALCVAIAAFPFDASRTSEEEAPDPVVTLYARDDLRSSFDFRDGREGGRVVDGEIVLDDAQIVFDVFQEGMLSFGFVRGERVNVIDLGPAYVAGVEHAADNAPKFAISVFHTLFLERSQLAYLDSSGKTRRLGAADVIFSTLPPEGLYHIEPKVGHTYLLRAKRKGAGADEMLVKFQVIEVRPGAALTLRWANVP